MNSSRDLLVEIGLEEMPARFVTDSMNQLAEKVEKWLQEQKISFHGIKKYSTPRRLTVLVEQVAEKQEDVQEEAKGPAKKIAIDDEGNWTKAAIGFSKGQGVSVEDIYFKEVNGVEYAFVQKFIKGKETIKLLTDIKELIKSLSFPKNMRWGSYDLRYVRPIQWLTVLFGNEVIPISITGVQASNVSYGHRFIGSEVTITEPSQYEEALYGQNVIVDYEKRKQFIREQLQSLEKEQNWIIPIDEDLLEEVTNLVEYPQALYGTFEEEYLNLPDEVLITTMREHQRYFPVKDQSGNLLPFFVTVRNGDSNYLENVARGNEKVLRARLSDANFFYQEDQKLTIESALEKLDKIVFHEELGTVGNKVNRIVSLSVQLGERLGLNETELSLVERAAKISKFDLVTQMVYEFPELQGIMGEKYARLKGESEEVAVAINEHYMPRHAEDEAPESTIGAIVGIADKLDTITGFFSIGKIPSGSQDPYALRRQASGIVQTLKAKNWRIPLSELFELAMNEYKIENRHKLEEEIISFFKLRIKYVLQEQGVRYDIVDAILESSYHEINSYFDRANVLVNESQLNEFKEVVEALSRVINISKKGEEGEIDESLFQKEEEKALYQAYLQLKEVHHDLTLKGDYVGLFSRFKELKEDINAYFDHIMIMAEDENIRQNRLSQMVQLANIITSFANLNSIIVK